MMTIDENGADAYQEDWDWALGTDGKASNGQRVTTALALRIAADVLRSLDPIAPSCTHPWTTRDLKLARAAISGVRAQQGVTGPDADFLGQPDGLMATHQIDIWIYG